MNKPIKDLSKRIAELITQGIEAWLEAGKILVGMLDEGYTLDRIAENAGISKDILTRFEAIGRNNLYPKLLASTSPGARALIGCGFSEQKQFCHEPIEILIVREGVQDTLKVDLDALTNDQCKQVFGRGHVRSLAEQRAYLESKAEEERTRAVTIAEDAAGYILKGHRVTFKKGVSMGKEDLIKILARM